MKPVLKATIVLEAGPDQRDALERLAAGTDPAFCEVVALEVCVEGEVLRENLRPVSVAMATRAGLERGRSGDGPVISGPLFCLFATRHPREREDQHGEG